MSKNGTSIFPAIQYDKVISMEGSDKAVTRLVSKLRFTGDNAALERIRTAIIAYRETSNSDNAKNLAPEAILGDGMTVRLTRYSDDGQMSRKDAIEANKTTIMNLLDILDERGMTSREQRPNTLVTQQEILTTPQRWSAVLQDRSSQIAR